MNINIYIYINCCLQKDIYFSKVRNRQGFVEQNHEYIHQDE